MEDNHWKVLNENIYIYIQKKSVKFKNIQSNYMVKFNFKGVFQIKQISQMNKDHVKILIMFTKYKISIARLNIVDFQLKKLFQYFKLQKYLIFASNLIFWEDHRMMLTSTWKSKNIRVFKLTGFYKVPYELRKLVPKFINIKSICHNILAQNYVSERINDIFLQTFKINNLNEELVETRQIGNFYFQKYELVTSFLQNKKNYVKIYYVDSDYVKNAQGVHGSFQIQVLIDVEAINKFKETILIFYSSSTNNYIYLKNVHSNSQKIFEFGKQYCSSIMRKPKFFQDNVVLRERFQKRRILIISIYEQLNQVKYN